MALHILACTTRIGECTALLKSGDAAILLPPVLPTAQETDKEVTIRPLLNLAAQVEIYALLEDHPISPSIPVTLISYDTWAALTEQHEQQVFWSTTQ